jgi:hypothetical protein
MKKNKDKNVTGDSKFIPREMPTNDTRFVPYKQDISREANANKPFVPLTVEDALARLKKDK